MILQSQDFTQCLDVQSVRNVALCNSLLHSIVSPHIQNNCTFGIPASFIMNPSHHFLKFYEKAKKMAYKLQLEYSNHNLPSLLNLPPLVTHFTGTQLILSPSLTYLCVYHTNLPNLRSLHSLKYLAASQCDPLNLPPSLTWLKIKKSGESIDFTNLPNITHISFYTGFNHSIEILPSAIIYLDLGFSFNQPVNNLPSTLIFVRFHKAFNQPVDRLPPGLQYLFIKSEVFDHSLESLPQNLTSLHLYFSKFSYSLDHLPLSITKFTYKQIGRKATPDTPTKLSSLPGNILHLVLTRSLWNNANFPKSLKYLNLSRNNPSEKIIKLENLPNTLTTLICGVYLRSADYLPSPLVRIVFGEKFNGPVDHLPANLINVTFGIEFNHPVDYLPVTLTHLTFGHHFNQNIDYLPHSLLYLETGRTFCQPVDNLPNSITTLCFRGKFDGHGDHLPSSLKSLFSYNYLNKSLDNLPSSIVEIYIGNTFNEPVDNFPPSVELISFGDEFNHPVDHLPPNLSKLRIRGKFNQKIDNLPKSLVKLEISGIYFDQSLENLPPLKYFSLYTYYDNNIRLRFLPPSLIHLEIGGIFPFIDFSLFPNLVSYRKL